MSTYKPKGYTMLKDGFSFDITVFSDFQRVKARFKSNVAFIGIQEAITGNIPYWSDGLGIYQDKNLLFLDFIKYFEFKEDSSLTKSIAAYIGKMFNQQSILWVSQSYYLIIECVKYIGEGYIPEHSIISLVKSKLKTNQHPTFKQLVNGVI